MKKILSVLGVVLILSVVMIGATLINNYFERDTTLDVIQPAEGYGEYIQEVSGESGDTIEGELITFSNRGKLDREINIFSNNDEDEIEVRYIYLYNGFKISDSNNLDLTILSNTSVEIRPIYTLDILLETGTYNIKTTISPV